MVHGFISKTKIVTRRNLYTWSIRYDHVAILIGSKSIKWKWKVDKKTLRNHGLIRKHTPHQIQDHANCAVCYNKWNFHATKPPNNVHDELMIYCFIRCLATLKVGGHEDSDRKGSHDNTRSVSWRSWQRVRMITIHITLDHGPILQTHHENLTCWDEVKQQHICAFSPCGTRGKAP